MIRLLVVAAAIGVITGVIAVSGHILAVVAHAIGGVVALACVGVVARHMWNRTVKLLIGGMVIANLTGVAWTVYGATAVVVIAHVITGVAASAGALIVATNRANNSSTEAA